MKNELNLTEITETIEEIKRNLSSATGFFDGLAMMSMNPGASNISEQFHSRIEDTFKLLDSLESKLKK